MREEEENREADKAFAEKIEARNALESYVYSLRTSMQALDPSSFYPCFFDPSPSAFQSCFFDLSFCAPSHFGTCRCRSRA